MYRLLNYGVNDIYLSPTITFFKITYRKYRNFVSETIKIKDDKDDEYEKNCIIKRKHDEYDIDNKDDKDDKYDKYDKYDKCKKKKICIYEKNCIIKRKHDEYDIDDKDVKDDEDVEYDNCKKKKIEKQI
jgi:hypothetical protein